jgi:putative ABC transport system permease protein
MKHRPSPRPDLIQTLFGRFIDEEILASALEDIQDRRREIAEKNGYLAAVLVALFKLSVVLLAFLIDSLKWRTILLKNYLKIALRNIKKHKGYSFINTAGLALGLACSMFIFLYVSYETSFDKYHPDADRIFHIKMKLESKALHNFMAWDTAPTIVPALKAVYPQVEAGARIKVRGRCRVKYEDKLYLEPSFVYADQEFFDVFSVPFILGSAEGALIRPNTVVFTERMAQKYFGEKNPLGSMIRINDMDLEVTGVIPDYPSNTRLRYNLFVSFPTYATPERDSAMKSWVWAGFSSYIKLRPGVDAGEFGRRIKHLAYDHVRDFLEKEGYSEHACFLQSLKDMHLNRSGVARLYLYIFSAIGFLIILIACINFMNLVTARAANRAREIGVRKVVGALRGQLVRQFLSESMVLAFFSLGFALALVFALLPSFSRLTHIQFSPAVLIEARLAAFYFILTAVVGLTAGSYPALYLSALKPVRVLKGSLTSNPKGAFLRKALVIGQFTVSISLIICTVTLYRQLNYMKDKPLGFDKEQKLVLPMTDNKSFAAYKQEFLSLPGIRGVTASLNVPGRMSYWNSSRLAEQTRDEWQILPYHFMDRDFLGVYNIPLRAGKNFGPDAATKEHAPCIINSSALEALGLDFPHEAVGRTLMDYKVPREIVGVTEDFFWRGVQRRQLPLIMVYAPRHFNNLTLALDTTDLQRLMSQVEKKWKALFPEDVFRFYFLNDDFNRLYGAEERLGKIVGIFALLAVVISCLGLFGLAAFTAEQRSKEIGIRKILGASAESIAAAFSKDFTRWVLLANIPAWPLAYFAVNTWLKNFAHRIDIGISTYVLSAAAALVIALLTVGFQSVKAARTEPVHSLRYE